MILAFLVLMNPVQIEEKTNDPAINLALDTLRMDKQAIFFCNSKRGAEALAERISKKLLKECCPDLGEQVLNDLSKPTRQCKRLAMIIRKGISFHHAGLSNGQRSLIEDSFREGRIRIICATPTLAFGLDMPAFRVVIKDVKRFTQRGMDFIPVLEYEQMSGRAGRPGKEDFGQAISIANSESMKEGLVDRYIQGKPEEIYSKLAVEPVLRTYVLSLISSGYVDSEDGLLDFFSKTFYAHQYGDLAAIDRLLHKMIGLLEEWGFVKGRGEDFQSALELKDGSLEATDVGRRVSELYLDPLSADYIITCLKNAGNRIIQPFSFLFMVSRCLEIRPYLRVKMSEYDDVLEGLAGHDSYLLEDEPSEFTPEFDEFLMSFKTALFFEEWIEEAGEDYLLEKYSIRPGEVRVKLDVADWLLFCTEELCRLHKMHSLRNEVIKVRKRLKYGAKEELLPLLRLKNIGRVRARTLFKNGLKSIADIRQAPLHRIQQLLGPKTAADVKNQVGNDKL